MKSKYLRKIIIVSLLIGVVNLGMKLLLAWGDFNWQKVKINRQFTDLSQAMIFSGNPGNQRNFERWQVSARGELTEDCLLYGICSDNKNSR